MDLPRVKYPGSKIVPNLDLWEIQDRKIIAMKFFNQMLMA
jgi:hypothetical protein